MGDGHGGIDKVASSWTLCGWVLLRGPFVDGALRGWSPSWTRATVTLRGWSPLWTRTTVTLRGLKSLSTWMYGSTTHRNHAKISVSTLRLHSPNPSLYPLMQCFTFCCYTLRIASVG